MSGWEYQTYKLIWDQRRGHFLDESEATLPAGYIGHLPDLWAGNSFELLVDVYEYYESAAVNQKMNFGDAATGALKIGRINSTDTADTLASGADVTITQVGGTGEYYRVTCQVHKGDLLAEYAGYECLLFCDVDGGSYYERTFAQALDVVDEQGTAAETLETKDLTASVVEITATGALTAYAGPVVYLVNPTANVVLTLPAEDQNQDIIIQNMSATWRVDIPGTINGTADALNGAGKGLENKAGCHLLKFYDSIALAWVWLNLNHTVIVR